MVASICLNIGHILLQGTISYISALTTSCQISPVLILVTQITFESLPLRAFLSPLEEEKMRRRIRQRVCQLTHSDLEVSHGLGKKARPGGTSRGRGRAYYLPYTALHKLESSTVTPLPTTPTTITRPLCREPEEDH